MDFEIQEFIDLEFAGFKSISELMSDSTSIPKVRGVYCILCTDEFVADFLQTGCGGHFKKKNPNISLTNLTMNWVKNAKVIYIGKAGSESSKSTLNERLKAYLNFGRGKPVGHWGGRLIWQLKQSHDLIICWKALPKENPREYEAGLIKQFVNKFGKRPFANLVD